MSLETYKQASPTPVDNTESENIRIINKIYRDFLARDMRSVLDALDENIDWDGKINWPGGPQDLPYSGKKRGREEVAEAFQQFMLTFEFAATMSQNTYVESGDTVSVTGSDLRTILPTGETTENRWTMIWTIRNGKATKFRMYQDTVPKLL